MSIMSVYRSVRGYPSRTEKPSVPLALPCRPVFRRSSTSIAVSNLTGGAWSLDRPWGPHSLVYSGYRVFPGVKWPRRDVDHPPTSSAEVKERVELDLNSPSGLSLPVQGKTLPFTFVGRAWICLDQCSPVRVEAPRRAGLPCKGHTEVHKTRFVKKNCHFLDFCDL